MKLELFYVPTSDLPASLALYRDAFGGTELWREGDTTVALTFPGTETYVMLDSSNATRAAGPTFAVDKVADFHASLPAGLTVVKEPTEIPGGNWAIYTDAGGTNIYVVDQATDSAVS